jgi:rubredoxin
MEYYVFPEYDNRPKSPGTTRSTLAGEELVVVAVHAVAREDDGTMRMQTVCDEPAQYNPAQPDPTPWDTVDLSARCPKCQAEIASEQVMP